jgi:uncharacterized protein (DUF1800 family)
MSSPASSSSSAASKSAICLLLLAFSLLGLGRSLIVSPALAASAEVRANPGHGRLPRGPAANTGTTAVSQAPLPRSSDAQIVHLLNRISFGARPGDVAAVKAMGMQNYVAAQLSPSSVAQNQTLDSQIRSSDVLNMTPANIIIDYRQEAKQRKDAKQQLDQNNQGQNIQGQNNAKQKQDNGFKKYFGQEAIKIKLARAVNSQRQLEEVMTDFWFNHFNISIDKGLDRVLVGSFEEQAIRPYVLGRFRDLLGATCYHPAMLFYLDNWQNVKAGATARTGKVSGINENYARELMELHTLGVDGGYSQKDVQELARVLTGLGLPRLRDAMGPRGIGGNSAKWGSFSAKDHDFGDKVVVGQRIAGSGAGEIDQALDLLARHPATAHHIAFQLAQYFVTDNPPKSLVDKLAQTFSSSDGNIKTVMQTLLASPEFWDPRYENSKFKSPFRYVVSTCRATNLEPTDYTQLAQFLRLQGEPVYGCLTPDGYKNTQAAWLNPDALINRINFATAVSSGKNRFTTPAPSDYRSIIDTVNGGALSARSQAVIAKSPPALQLPLLLGSPEFMRY